jgi:FlgD Ig-like domain
LAAKAWDRRTRGIPGESETPMVSRGGRIRWSRELGRADYAVEIPIPEVFDVRGRLVARITSGTGPTQAFTWDGMDSRGRTVAAGVYFIHVEVGGESLSTKTVLVR